MREFDWVNDTGDSTPRLIKFAGLALFIEALILIIVGWHEHWLAHPKKASNLEDQFIEAQVYRIPEHSHLVENKKNTPAVPHPSEATLSKKPGVGKASRTQSPPLEEENQTQAGPQMPPTHGPVAVYAPAPVIPSYLQNQEFKTSVVIDFYVNANGFTVSRLVGSSGNEELDAIALKTAQRWQFRPAEKDHKAIDSKVRLRIIFKVE